MLYRIETPKGYISVERGVIDRIVAEAAARLSGRVFLSNHKGKIIPLKMRYGSFDAKNCTEIRNGKDGLDIRVNVVVRFGTSIGMVTEQLITEIKQDIERYAGTEANSIAIAVTGLISKKIARRSIEIKG